jgi:hypothetical protein
MMGFRVVVDASLVERVQHSRSPGRAKRRQRRGFRQHYATIARREAIILGDTMFVHPLVFANLKAQLLARERLALADPDFMRRRILTGSLF